MFNINNVNSAYFKWKRCMLDNQYQGIDIISSSFRCEDLYKKYKILKTKENNKVQN